MASIAGFCTSFMRELLCAEHAFGPGSRTSTADAFKAALYTSLCNLSPETTTEYTTDQELVGAGYAAGGLLLENNNPPVKITAKAYWSPSAPAVWTDATLTDVETILLYNSTLANKAIGIWKITPKSVVAGTLTLTLPDSSPANALIQVT